ncbi:MAG: LPS-assembly protein LptD [Treponema sp.]|jgi:hypothetical protein|nr:LPS-assembly protein LptD [Treponema sp.]
MKKYLLVVLVLLACSLAAQEEAMQAEESSVPDAAARTLRSEDILELDIKTSSLMELAFWCRSLGLSEGGTREELANRLRSFYGLPSQDGSVSEGSRTIIIESARTTEYFTIETVDEEYARLRGDVVVSLKDGDAVYRISAWEILYNRTRNVLTASGGVVYTKEEGSTIETFRGDSITVNLDNWSSIFLDGVSERSVSGSETTYRFSGAVISRNDEEVTVLTGAEITNAQNEEALWSLYASKLWLLPGSDFAFLNGILKVGNIPVLWIPAFYYPMDEIVFHPVLGSRPREGTFLQTTTYIFGRPKAQATAENSITRIFSSAEDGEQERVGLFLRTTGPRIVSREELSLSILFDAYTNLGFYLGTELSLPGKNNFGGLKLSFGLGMTRNIYQVRYGNSPFANYDGTSEWNSSYLFALNIPLRFRMEMTGSLSFAQGSFSWNIPFYSDPYVNRDFMNRSEVLDWLAMLREGANSQQASDSSISSYEWRLDGSFTPNVRNLSPYITSLSIPNISSSLSFASRNTDPASYKPASPPNPGSMFFFPNKFVLFSVSASVAGTPYSSGQSTTATSGTAPAGPALLPSEPVSPWEEPEESLSPRIGADSNSLIPPVLNQRFDIASSGSSRLAFNYTLNPSAASELQFWNDANKWTNAESINWGEISSVLTRVRADSSLGLSLNHTGPVTYTGTLRVLGTGSWQNFNYLNEDQGPAVIVAARRRAYNETYLTSSYDFSFSLRPFNQNAIWRNSSFQYDLRGLLAKTVFDGPNFNITQQPKWNWEFGGWGKDKLSTNTISARLEASIMDQVQNLTLSAILPPLNSQITGNAVFRVWISETQIRNSYIFEAGANSRAGFQPVYLTEILRFNNRSSLEQYVVFDPRENNFTTLTTTLRLWDFTARYMMSYMTPYKLVLPSGWEQSGEKSLVPQELSFSYNYRLPAYNFGNSKLSFSFDLRTSLDFDLQRYTYSKLTFSLGIEFNISKFLDIRLTTTSENAQMYWYFRNLPFFTTPVPLPANVETNFFRDLVNSFRFDSDTLRRSSAFKLKSFRLDLVHHLGDWDATLGVALSPYLDRTQTVPSWKFNTEISFMVRWIPIQEIRTEIVADRDGITFK